MTVIGRWKIKDIRPKEKEKPIVDLRAKEEKEKAIRESNVKYKQEKQEARAKKYEGYGRTVRSETIGDTYKRLDKPVFKQQEKKENVSQNQKEKELPVSYTENVRVPMHDNLKRSRRVVRV